MRLDITWDGPTGPNINYIVEYKLSDSSGPWTTAITGLHNNFYSIDNLADNFYDVRVSTVCSLVTVNAVFQRVGKSPCSNPVFSNYTVLSETVTDQTIRITLTNYKPNIKVKVTRLNDNILISEAVVSTLGTFDVSIQKGSPETLTYKVEVANVCTIGQSDYINAGVYSAGYIIRGIDLLYENFQAGYTTKYKNLQTTDTYNNPLTIPPQKYDVTIETPVCGTVGKVTVTALSGTTEMFTLDLTSPINDGKFKFPFVNLNLLNGPTGGTYITSVKFKFTCN